MEPIYKKCLMAATQINEQLLPAMGQEYKQFSRNTQDMVLGHDSLNESRKFSKAAIEVMNTSQSDNKNIRTYLFRLEAIDKKLDMQSRKLHDLLSSIKDKFANRSKKIAQLNHEYLIEIKDGNTPARELLISIAKLGKDVQKVINEEIPGYKKEVDFFMKKTANDICDEAHSVYNKIQKLDEGTLPHMRTREWTTLPDAYFRTSGAFVNGGY